MHPHWGGRAVIDKQAWGERLERELRAVPWCGERRSRAATRPSDRMQVDIVRHLRARVIAQMEFDEIALADADEEARHLAAECPEEVVHAIRHSLHHLANLE